MQKQFLAIFVASAMAVSAMASQAISLSAAAATSITMNDAAQDLYASLNATYQEAQSYYNTIFDKVVNECPKAVAAGSVNDSHLMSSLNTIKSELDRSRDEGVLEIYQTVFNRQIKDFYIQVDQWYADCLELEENYDYADINAEEYKLLNDRNMGIQIYLMMQIPSQLAKYPKINLNDVIDNLKDERRTVWAKVEAANRICALWRSFDKYNNWMTNFENKVYFLPTMAKMKNDGVWVDESGLYAKAMETVDALKNNLSNTLTKIKSNCPDVYHKFTGKSISESIEALSDTIGNHYYFNTLRNIEGEIATRNNELTAEISALYESAVAAQSGSSSDQDALYAECMTRLVEVQDYLDKTLATIDELYPHASEAIHEMVDSELSSYLDPLMQALNDHYAAGTMEEFMPEFNATIEQLRASIDSLYGIAEEKEADYLRREKNEAAYNADMERLNRYAEEGYLILLDLMTNNPELDVEGLWQDLIQALNEQGEAATAEYEAVMNSGEYSYVLDVEKIESILNELNMMKEQVGVETVSVEDLDGAATIYNLRGERVDAPVSGQINIFVDVKGNARKVFVK